MVLQVPQFRGSLATLVHPPAQSTWLPVHLLPAMHSAPEHTDPTGHVSPHPPQLLGSVFRSTHFAPHWTSPMAHRQIPAMHLVLPEQAVPQVPQLLSSVRGSTQMPPQSSWPDGHLQVPPIQNLP